MLGAAYAPVERVGPNGQRRAARRFVAYVPPGLCRSPWYAGRVGRVRVVRLSGRPLPPSSGDHWAVWAGEEIREG